MPSKNPVINLRMTPEQRDRFQRFCEKTGLDEPAALRALVDAFCEAVERDGGVFLPLKIVSKNAPVFPSTVVLPSPTPDRIRLNQPAAQSDNAPVSKTRRALQKMVAKEAEEK
jgi:hypothetical protein